MKTITENNNNVQNILQSGAKIFGISSRTLVRAKALCVNTVRCLIEDKRCADAIDAALMYSAGIIDAKELAIYEDRAMNYYLAICKDKGYKSYVAYAVVTALSDLEINISRPATYVFKAIEATANAACYKHDDTAFKIFKTREERVAIRCGSFSAEYKEVVKNKIEEQKKVMSEICQKVFDENKYKNLIQ